MAKDYYLPDSDAKLDEWLDNYIAKLPGVAASMGVSDDEVTVAVTRVTAYKDSLNTVANKKAEQKAAVETKNDEKKEVRDYIMPLNQRMKQHSGYTPAKGDLLNIIGSESGFDSTSFKPGLTVENIQQGRLLKFVKSEAEGVNVSAREKGESSWTFLGVDLHSPYLDSRSFAQPIELEYKVTAFLDDEEIGVDSDIVSIVSQPD